MRKVLFNHSAIDTSKLNSNAAARDALRSAMCPAKGSASFGEAMYYVKAYRADPRAQKLKAGLKQMYQRINKVLGKQIDVNLYRNLLMVKKNLYHLRLQEASFLDLMHTLQW